MKTISLNTAAYARRFLALTGSALAKHVLNAPVQNNCAEWTPWITWCLPLAGEKCQAPRRIRRPARRRTDETARIRTLNHARHGTRPPPLVPQNDDACITFTFSPENLNLTIVIPATEAISSVKACTGENGEYLKIRVTYRPPGTDEWAYLYAKYRMKSFLPFVGSFFYY